MKPGTGMNNMSDRLDALGGKLSVESSLGEGTTVRGEVPVAAPVVA
jgi:signal transduction histidine kinase